MDPRTDATAQQTGLFCPEYRAACPSPGAGCVTPAGTGTRDGDFNKCGEHSRHPCLHLAAPGTALAGLGKAGEGRERNVSVVTNACPSPYLSAADSKLLREGQEFNPVM
ncbi:hypothetical protein NDU88_000748 [Pleurodeles waltl]|uniref:Uncharacterized protein n=1 Tax=Pleurodeles waltl TaxID=8319 RepID=A0AAV7S637_PLEWA|nr:hypothetical protein NDU88_000748 [Pleurodeles waltl]